MIHALLLASALALAAPSPEAASAHKEGLRLAKSNMIPEAIEQLEKAVKIDPDFSEAWSDLGNTHLSAGSMPDAIRCFERAVKVRPDFQIARYNLAYALRKTGDHARAAEHYRVYLQRDPDDADAWYGLAESLRQANDNQAAAEAYEKYAQVEKRPAQAKWVAKAQEQAKTLRAGQPAKLAAKTATPAERGGEKPKHLSFSAKAKKEKAAGEQPVAAAVEVKQQPGLIAAPAESTVSEGTVAKRPASFDTALIALRAGDYESALPQLEAAATAAPEDAFVLAALGSAHLGLRNAKEARRAYQRALASAQPAAVPGIWLGLGEAARVLGEKDEAAEAYAKAEEGSDAVRAAARDRRAAL